MKLLREQGDMQFDLGSTKNILGSIKKIIQGARRKGSNFKGSSEMGEQVPIEHVKSILALYCISNFADPL